MARHCLLTSELTVYHILYEKRTGTYVIYYQYTLTHLDVRDDALILKNVALD